MPAAGKGNTADSSDRLLAMNSFPFACSIRLLESIHLVWCLLSTCGCFSPSACCMLNKQLI